MKTNGQSIDLKVIDVLNSSKKFANVKRLNYKSSTRAYIWQEGTREQNARAQPYTGVN